MSLDDYYEKAAEAAMKKGASRYEASTLPFTPLPEPPSKEDSEKQGYSFKARMVGWPENVTPKHDEGKPRAGLVLGDFSRALLEVAKVGTFGAEKYSDHGWLSVEDNRARYLDALWRHLLAKEERDSESGYSHLAHVAWNALAVLELDLMGERSGT